MAKTDSVNHPVHYNSLGAVCSKCGHPIECIDVTEHLGFSLGNAVKYLWRAGLKDGATMEEDLKKSLWYITRKLERLTK